MKRHVATLATVGILCAALLTPTAGASQRSEARLKDQVATLQSKVRAQAKRIRRLEVSLTGARASRDAERERATAASTRADRLAVDNEALTTENARLRGENEALKGSVPDQVRAIAREDNIQRLFNLVILPAFNAWPCRGSLFYGQTFWSVDFDRRDASDGTCY